MGKVVAEGLAVSSPDAVAAEFSGQNAAEDAASLRRSRRCVGIRCVVALLFSAAVVLSAIFWLPPFTQHADQVDLDPDPRLRGHDIVAGFKVEKPVSLLEDNILQLADDIFDEIGVLNTKVVIIYIEPFGPNITEVIFAVDSDVKNSKVSATSQSVIREYLESLVTNRSQLFLTTALFGHPFLFEVLKFPGGFTVIPLQNAFLLQKVQILFNFTLNFSIHQIQENFHELANQLQSGLHLASYENLYISLTNLKGSTVAPPTTIQSSVLLAFGTPSTTRLKELAQTITGSPARNLGLNNSVFGKVKQVSLSSMLQHSLHGDDGNLPPAPAPLPHPHHNHNHNHHHRQHHHHHHHHHRHQHNHCCHHHDESQFAPDIAPTSAPGSTKDPPAHRKISPSPAPAPIANSRPPEKSGRASPGCQNRRTRSSTGKTRKQPRYLVPAPAPLIGPRPRCSTALSCLPAQPPLPASSSFSYRTPASSPLPSVVLASPPPLPTRKNDAVPLNISPSSTSEGFRHPCHWALALLFLALRLCL